MNKTLFSSNSEEWATPGDFFEELNREFKFDLDPCATAENHKTPKFFTKEQNGLLQDWGGSGFFVIRPTAGKSGTGSRRHTKKDTKTERSSFFLFRQGQTRSIFTITS